MNLPNMLTLSRLGMAAILIALLSLSFPFFKTLALVVFVIAGITDFFDGYLARNVYGVTSFGRLMDPLTDKVLVCAAFICFVDLGIVPAWIVIIIVAREFMVTGLRLLAASKGKIISAGQWGKHKTVWQIVAIIVILLGLALQNDVLRTANEELMSDFNYAFKYIAWGVSVAVAAITATSGALYFSEHKELITRNL